MAGATLREGERKRRSSGAGQPRARESLSTRRAGGQLCGVLLWGVDIDDIHSL